MNNGKQPFYKNYGCIASILALIYLVLDLNGIISIVPDQYSTIVNLVLGILVGAGVISNPQDGKGYTNPGFDVNEVLNAANPNSDKKPEDGADKNN